MSLNGVEVAAKISGKAAERLAVLLYAILKEQKRTRGKIRLANMLRSGKELKVFAVKDSELQKFCEEAKEYGVLYCVLKDNEANDGLTDIMVRAEDASKINRIFERFNLATVDMGSVQTEIETAREAVATSTLEALLSSLSASSPFSKLLISIRRSVGVRLPNTALLELPTVLTSDTQERLIKLGETRGIEIAGEVILDSIDEINKGSLETVDNVIRTKLMETTAVH